MCAYVLPIHTGTYFYGQKTALHFKTFARACFTMFQASDHHSARLPIRQFEAYPSRASRMPPCIDVCIDASALEPAGAFAYVVLRVLRVSRLQRWTTGRFLPVRCSRMTAQSTWTLPPFFCHSLSLLCSSCCPLWLRYIQTVSHARIHASMSQCINS